MRSTVNQARVNLPTDRVIDGRDLSPLLFSRETSLGARTWPVPKASFRNQPADAIHDCIYHWKGTPGLGCPAERPNCPGLWAVRCGQYKLHYVTSNWTSGSSNGEFHDPPLVYHIEHDPGENFPLGVGTEEYAAARAMIEAKAKAHRASIRSVPNQIAKGVRKDLQICCDPNSKKKYPLRPLCTCDESSACEPSCVLCFNHS